jgi:hypothetical protein
MAAVQEYRHKKCLVLGLALGDVPLDMFDEVHQYMEKRLPEQDVAYLGVISPLIGSYIQRLSYPCCSCCLADIWVCHWDACRCWFICLFRALRRKCHTPAWCAGTFPVLPELSSVTLDQVYHTLSGKLLFTELEQLQMGTPVPEFYVATSFAGEMLNYLIKSNRPLLITTPDRIDTLTTAIAAHSSGVAPLSGVSPY